MVYIIEYSLWYILLKKYFTKVVFQTWNGLKLFTLPYFRDHKAHLKSFIFAKIDRAPYKPVRLMHEPGSALCFIAYTQN